MWIEIQNIFEKSDCPEDFSRSYSGSPRQIGNTVLGGCNRRPLEKITAFKICLFGAAPSRESSFFIKTSSTTVLRPTKSTIHILFSENYSYFVIFGFKSTMHKLGIRCAVITYKDSWSLVKRNVWNFLCCVIIIDSQTRRSQAIELSV